VRATAPACASLLTALAVTLPAGPAQATGPVSAAAGCVSNADHARLSVGLRLSRIHAIAGADAELSRRTWTRAGERYHERLYAMCTPRDDAHNTLTTRFRRPHSVWRAFLVDTHVGPCP
jgi:hypothetical protein